MRSAAAGRYGTLYRRLALNAPAIKLRFACGLWFTCYFIGAIALIQLIGSGEIQSRAPSLEQVRNMLPIAAIGAGTMGALLGPVIARSPSVLAFFIGAASTVGASFCMGLIVALADQPPSSFGAFLGHIIDSSGKALGLALLMTIGSVFLLGGSPLILAGLAALIFRLAAVHSGYSHDSR